MIQAQREGKILEILNESGGVIVEELANRFSVSVMTIRRDLDRLEERGLVERRHGGAILPGRLVGEETYETKAASHVEEKNRIAQKAATLVRDGDIVLLDGGPRPCRFCAPWLRVSGSP
jgi:DeoR/GlpR family transcriptional regulator of sugar metabolism